MHDLGLSLSSFYGTPSCNPDNSGYIGDFVGAYIREYDRGAL